MDALQCFVLFMQNPLPENIAASFCYLWDLLPALSLFQSVLLL